MSRKLLASLDAAEQHGTNFVPLSTRSTSFVDQLPLGNQALHSHKKLHVVIAKIAYFYAGVLPYSHCFDIQSHGCDLSTSSVDNPHGGSDNLSWQPLVLSEGVYWTWVIGRHFLVSPTSRGYREEKSAWRMSQGDIIEKTGAKMQVLKLPSTHLQLKACPSQHHLVLTWHTRSRSLSNFHLQHEGFPIIRESDT